MTTSASDIDRLVTLLGGWPEHFEHGERKHGERMLAVLRQRRLVDEAVFGIVIRYAVHSAAFERLSKEIAKQKIDATESNYLSGDEQSRAYHENKLLTLERELVATPYARLKNGVDAQTSFMAIFDSQPPPEDNSGDGAKVVHGHFAPMPKRGRG